MLSFVGRSQSCSHFFLLGPFLDCGCLSIYLGEQEVSPNVQVTVIELHRIIGMDFSEK